MGILQARWRACLEACYGYQKNDFFYKKDSNLDKMNIMCNTIFKTEKRTHEKYNNFFYDGYI